MANLIELTFGKDYYDKHEFKKGNYACQRYEEVKKMTCFRKYIKLTWNKYNQQSIKTKNFDVIVVDGRVDNGYKSHLTFFYVNGQIMNCCKPDLCKTDSIIVKYLPYFTKLALFSRLSYDQINMLNLNIFSRGIIWLLWHLERVFNPRLYK